jgi:hypothetical protein
MHSNPTSRQTSAIPSLYSQMSSTVVDYTPWMRQKARPVRDNDSKQAMTMVVGLPRTHVSCADRHDDMLFLFDHLAVREERKCSALCRHMPREPTAELSAPEDPEKIQWLHCQLQSKRSTTRLVARHSRVDVFSVSDAYCQFSSTRKRTENEKRSTTRKYRHA